jgi:hypothetical protein
MGSVIKDFYKSDAPQFKGRSKEKRREMAIAAKLEAERGPQNEAVARDKEGNDKFDRYKRMVRHKQDKYGPSTLKQRLTHGGVDHNIDNERKAKMKNEGMSPKEIMLQKKKAMIDQKIARDRKKQLNKAEPEAPTKAMGEEVVSERTRYAKETGKDFTTGKPSEKGGTRTGKTPFDKVSREMRKTGGVMSARGKGIQPQGKKKVPGAKGYKGTTPVDKIRNRLAQKRAEKPNPYRARAGESD